MSALILWLLRLVLNRGPEAQHWRRLNSFHTRFLDNMRERNLIQTFSAVGISHVYQTALVHYVHSFGLSYRRQDTSHCSHVMIGHHSDFMLVVKSLFIPNPTDLEHLLWHVHYAESYLKNPLSARFIFQVKSLEPKNFNKSVVGRVLLSLPLLMMSSLAVLLWVDSNMLKPWSKASSCSALLNGCPSTPCH